jgi:hypothetical protein
MIFDHRPTVPDSAGHAGQSFDPRPDTDELLQDSDPTPGMVTIPVCVEGPVRTQQMPRTAGVRRTVTVGTSPKRVLTADPRRASVVLLAQGNPITVGSSQSEATGAYAALWPAWTPLTLSDTEELWVAAPAGDTSLTVLTDAWAG